MNTIGFIGLGNMGGPMAVNLVAKGFSVTAFDLDANALKAFESKGGKSAPSASEAAQDADIVISMLPASRHVEGLYLGDSGLIQVMAENALVIDASTIDAATAKSVAAQLNEKGIRFIDAPVSGGTAGAQAGTLTFIVGGTTDDFERAKPALSAMGANLFHAGDVGAGQVAKICNNMLLAVLMCGTSEALQLGIDHGLDPATLSEIMKSSSGANWTLEKYNPCPGVMDKVPSSNDYQGGFMSALMLKDLGLAMASAQTSQSTVAMGSLAHTLYNLHAKNSAERDFSSIFEFIRQSANNQ